MSDRTRAEVKALVKADKICYVCEDRAPLPGLDEFHGHSCQQCRQMLAEARLKSATGRGYSERPRGDSV